MSSTTLAKPGTAKRAAQDERAEAIAKLRELFPAGSTVYTINRHTSASGMSRSISVLVQDSDGPREVSYLVARALDYRIDQKRGGLVVGGCGMDMGFHVAHNLAATLYPEGFGCTGEKCPSNDHSNGDRDHTPHGHRGPNYVLGDRDTLRHWHASGGYALRHRWL